MKHSKPPRVVIKDGYIYLKSPDIGHLKFQKKGQERLGENGKA